MRNGTIASRCPVQSVEISVQFYRRSHQQGALLLPSYILSPSAGCQSEQQAGGSDRVLGRKSEHPLNRWVVKQGLSVSAEAGDGFEDLHF